MIKIKWNYDIIKTSQCVGLAITLFLFQTAHWHDIWMNPFSCVLHNTKTSVLTYITKEQQHN